MAKKNDYWTGYLESCRKVLSWPVWKRRALGVTAEMERRIRKQMKQEA